MRTAAVLGLGILAGLNSIARADDLLVKLASITTPVHPGGVVTLVVHTQVGAVCEGKRQGHFDNAYFPSRWRRSRPARTGWCGGSGRC